MNQQKLGNFLKQLRKDKGLTQEQLAEYFCISSRTVSRWETGRNLPDIDMIIELADFYNVDIRELLNGEWKDKPDACESKETLKQVADYAKKEESRTQSKWTNVALVIAVVLLICTKLFAGEAKGVLYGIVPESICSSIMLLMYGSIAAFLIAYLKARWFQETPSRESEKLVNATVISKEIRAGTHGAGRSKGGFSYMVSFLTESGEALELFAYELEFGSLKEGMRGLLTYQGRYFVRFQEMENSNH